MDKFLERMKTVGKYLGEERHKAVPLFENPVNYPMDKLVQLRLLAERAVYGGAPEEELPEIAAKFKALQESIQPINDIKPIMLWPEGNMPEESNYTENPDFRYNHDPDFKPYMYEMLVPENVQPKGAVVVCAGGDHGDSVLGEGYQVCLDLNDLGYQCFLLLNRPNHNPYTNRECGADAARAIRIVRANAAKYRIPADRVAFAGFSNGGLTGESCIQYYSAAHTVKEHFPSYAPDRLDDFYGAPDAFLCVYGPRFVGEPFDYETTKYPPVFFAVGRQDSAMDNFNYVYPQLIGHGVTVEVHTFAGTPHGQAGTKILGGQRWLNFEMWLPLADAFMLDVYNSR